MANSKNTKTPEQLQKELYTAWFNVTLSEVLRPRSDLELPISITQRYKETNQKITKEAQEALKRKERREATEKSNKKQKTESTTLSDKDRQYKDSLYLDAAHISIAEQNTTSDNQPIPLVDTVINALLNVMEIDMRTDLVSTVPDLRETVKNLIDLIMKNDHSWALNAGSIQDFRQAVSDLYHVISENIPSEKHLAISEALVTVGKQLLKGAETEYKGRYKALSDNNPANIFLEPAKRVMNRARIAGVALIELGEIIKKNLDENNNATYHRKFL